MHKTLLTMTALVIIAAVSCGNAFGIEVRYTADKASTGSEMLSLGASSEEVDYVEAMAGYRNAYRAALAKLEAYYRSIGDDTKRGWAEKELKALDSIPWYRYVTPGDVATKSLMATDAITEADRIYAEALELEDQAKLLAIVVDDAKLQRALRKFEDVFQTYPTSDKIDDAVYKAATIYEHFKDYEIAVLYYQRAFQWNPDIKYKARLKAARILDYKLRKRKEALYLYQESLALESLAGETKEAVQNRITTLMTSDEVSGIEDDLKTGAAKPDEQE